MNLNVTNLEYNLIKKQLKILETAYKQSNDKKVLESVKTRVYFELTSGINEFTEYFGKELEACQMTNLKEIDELREKIMANLNIKHLPKIEAKSLKKKLKLSDKDLASLIRGYNESINKKPLTYYSQKIDEKLVILYYENEECSAAVCSTIKNKRSLVPGFCHFCNTVRSCDEILFIANTRATKKDYSSIGVYCCLNYEKCNADIIDTNNLRKFINYKCD